MTRKPEGEMGPDAVSLTDELWMRALEVAAAKNMHPVHFATAMAELLKRSILTTATSLEHAKLGAASAHRNITESMDENWPYVVQERRAIEARYSQTQVDSTKH